MALHCGCKWTGVYQLLLFVVWAPCTMPGHIEILKTYVLVEWMSLGMQRLGHSRKPGEPICRVQSGPCLVPWSVSRLPRRTDQLSQMMPLTVATEACGPSPVEPVPLSTLFSSLSYDGKRALAEALVTIESDAATQSSRGKALWCFLPKP